MAEAPQTPAADTAPIGPHLAIIDGHAQFFRAYYAIRGGLSSSVTGEPTNLVFGFISMLFAYIRAHRPTELVVVIDAAGDQETFRSQIYPEYKAHRDPAPDDFHPQVERCLEALRLMGIPVLGIEGVEADDVIATLVERMHGGDRAARIRMVSRDKDLGQLVDAHTTLFDPHKNADIGLEQLFDSKGVRPDQVVDLLALMGDTADNVPGIPGVGPKTAAALLAEYGSIEGIYDNLDKIKGKRGQTIAESRELVALSRRLVELKRDCAFPFDLADARWDPSRCDLPALLELLRVLGFSRLRSEAQEIFGGAAPKPKATADEPKRGGKRGAGRTNDAAEGGLFAPPADGLGASDSAAPAAKRHEAATFGTLFDAVAEADAPPVPERTLAVTVVRTAAELESMAREIRAAGRVAFDTETTSLVMPVARLVGLSFAVREGAAWYVPVRSPESASHLGVDEALAALRPLLEDPSIAKTGHNLKYDCAVLANHGVELRGIAGDSMLASWIVDPTRPSHGLDATSEHVLGVRPIPIEAVIGAKGEGQRRFDEAPLARAAPYAAEDAEIALALAARLEATVRERGQWAPYAEVEVPLVPVLARMERAGIRVDRDELSMQRRQLEVRLSRLREEIAAAAPHPFNPDSPKQLAAVLFNAPDAEPPGLGLRVVKRSTTGPSTDSEVLEKLAEDPACTSRLPEQILEYRQFAKLVGTYLKALDEAVLPETGRIHCSFHQTGTATGRLSSSDPNLQNIPIRTEVGAAIRRAFVADEGTVFVSADYSQIELRFLAHFSNDPGLCEAFTRGEDIHRAVAAQVFEVAPDAVSDVQRGAAKMVNFGIVYGITASGLARRLGPGYTVARAKEIIESYRERFRGIDAFLNGSIEAARRTGHATTITGRWRPIPQIHSRNPAERAFGERIAVNTVVQGSAADLIKIAMVRLDAALRVRHPKARLLLQIHDELLVEAPAGEADAVSALLAETMRSAMTLRVPLEVSAATGGRWSDV
ncbi:MAG: DNA polymerase I [Planctomycetota bacterium]